MAQIRITPEELREGQASYYKRWKLLLMKLTKSK